jgi:aryl-alcohol dehydrogenase (NADP+)
MDYTPLGRSGLRVSRLALGCMTYGSPSWRPWVLDEDASRPLLRAAIEAGINFFDTADMYSLGQSEEVLGRALRELRVNRDEVVIATKVYFPLKPHPNGSGLSRKHILASIDASLKRLGMDFVDLYQIHRFDPKTPVEETLDALDSVVRAGKALHIGASSMASWQFMKMLGLQRANGWARFISMQNHYNLIYREEEREMIPLCASEGIGVIPWSPLARGLLAASRAAGTTRSQTDEQMRRWYKDEADGPVIEAVSGVARDRGVPQAQIALAWLLSKGSVTAPIVGVSKPHHLSDALAALSLKLTPEEIERLEKPYIPHAVAGIL